MWYTSLVRKLWIPVDSWNNIPFPVTGYKGRKCHTGPPDITSRSFNEFPHALELNACPCNVRMKTSFPISSRAPFSWATLGDRRTSPWALPPMDWSRKDNGWDHKGGLDPPAPSPSHTRLSILSLPLPPKGSFPRQLVCPAQSSRLHQLYWSWSPL